MLACFATVLAAFSGGRFEDGALTPLGMLLFGAAMMLGGSIPDARRTLRELASLVEASRVEVR